MKKFIQKVWFWSKVSMGVGVAVGVGVLVGAMKFSVNEVQATNSVTVVDKMPEKVDALKEEVLKTLSSCEARGYKDGDAPIILDTNNKMSIGPFMFQVATVQHYYKTIYGKEITRHEATIIALDEEKARELAKAVIFDLDGLRNWLNCANKHNLRPKVDVIRSLEK